MKNIPTFKELLDCINKGSQNGKANCTLGVFANEYFDGVENEAEAFKEIDNLIIKKPIVEISSFIEDNEIYYNVRFCFRSYNDSDYKQLWKFICRHAEKAKREADQIEAGETISKVTMLSLSIIPDQYHGKHFAYINMPFWETITCSENAFDKSVVISLLCNDGSFAALSADDDLVDRRSVEREVEQELLAELEEGQEV